MRLPHRRVAALLLAALTATVVVSGCGGSDSGGGGSSGSRVEVVATTTVLGDLVRTVGGDAVSVTQLLAPNSDPHAYEPRPQDVVATSKASLVFASGDGLDHWIGDVAEQAGGDAKVVDVAQTLPATIAGAEHADDSDDGDHGDHGEADDADHGEADGHDHGPVDPHWWHDPTNVEAAVATIRDELTRADPAGRATYAANAAAYAKKLQALDAGIRRCLDGIPARQRKLVTDHDALGHFAARYGITIVGAVIPSRSTQAQPSAGSISDLAKVIRREGVRAVFPESGSSRKLPEAVAKETGATAAYQLYGDTLGPEDSAAGTYLGMEAHNADAMVRGFTGGARGCALDR